ncbi:MAG: alpha-ketoglutarate-dependent dioxygenase AlkB [Pseudomonadota bacterium]
MSKPDHEAIPPVATCFTPEFLNPESADSALYWLRHHVAWERERFTIFGRTRLVPRSLAWFGDSGVSYRYTGIEHTAHGWPRDLQRLRSAVEAHSGARFNFLLANRYDDGSQYMGWHRDDEPECSPLIASLSLGATRRFRIAAADPSDAALVYDLGHGSLLIFDGRRRHTLCKTQRRVAQRINLTFRQVQ